MFANSSAGTRTAPKIASIASAGAAGAQRVPYTVTIAGRATTIVSALMGSASPMSADTTVDT